MSVEREVATHYTRGSLQERIFAALQSAGNAPANLKREDLGALDNLHIGGQEATEDLAGLFELRPGMRLLDIGSGLGGPARHFANLGCEVTGIDLTEDFVQTASSLTRLLKLDDRVQFRQGSALEMPFESGTFDGAYMIHVGMNIQNKSGLSREVARVLKRGGRFVIFDLMGQEGSFAFPQPWAIRAEMSFVAPLDDYRGALKAAGFQIHHERDRRQFALEFMQKMKDRASNGAPPILGVHVLMGEQAPLMLHNANSAIASGALTPMELMASTN